LRIEAELKLKAQGRRWLYGNRKEFSPNYTRDGVDAIIKALPNNGLIRFYEALSREALLVTSVDAIKEITSAKPYHFCHPKKVKYMMSRITSSNFNFQGEHEHKVRGCGLVFEMIKKLGLTRGLLRWKALSQASPARLHSHAHREAHAGNVGQI
jgi:hypothetical protein